MRFIPVAENDADYARPLSVSGVESTAVEITDGHDAGSAVLSAKQVDVQTNPHT